MDRRQFVGCGSALAATGLASGAMARPGRAGEIPLGGAIGVYVEARRTAGLDVPERDGALDAAARRQVLHMAGSGAVSHLNAAGQDPDHRARQAGFAGRVLGETLAETRDGPEETMAVWLSHAPTRDVLMDPAVQRFGLAAVAGPDGRAWWLLATAT